MPKTETKTRTEFKTYNIQFGRCRGRYTSGPFTDVLVEATSHSEAVKKAAKIIANKYNVWVIY